MSGGARFYQVPEIPVAMEIGVASVINTLGTL